MSKAKKIEVPMPYGTILRHPDSHYDLNYMVVCPKGPDLLAIVLRDESAVLNPRVKVDDLIPGETRVISRNGWKVLG